MTTEAEVIYGDSGYTGEVVDETSAARFADLDYYRNKIREFQVHLNTLSTTADTMLGLRDTLSITDPQGTLVNDIDAWLQDFYANKSSLLFAAEAVNAASEGANAVGVRMPVLSIPMNLGFPPAIVAAVAAAVAGTAWAISYAVSKVTEARNLITRQETIALLPEDQRAAALAADQAIAKAQANAQSALGSVANIVKWLALGVAVWFGYKAIRETGLLGRA